MAGRTRTLTKQNVGLGTRLKPSSPGAEHRPHWPFRPPAPLSAAPTLSQLRLLGFSFLNFGLGNSGMALLLLFSHKLMGYT